MMSQLPVPVRARPERPALTHRQRRALVALLAEPSIAAAARVAGCHERTLRRWLEDAVFRAAYRRATGEALARVRDRLVAAAPEAVEGLVALASEGSEPTVRLRACVALVDATLRAGDVDLAERLSAIEERLGVR